MIILILFGVIAVAALLGLFMTTATHKTIVGWNHHGWFVGWPDSKVHGVGVGICVLGVVLMYAVIRTVIKYRRRP